MREMLFAMYKELEVTADEARKIADSIDNGKLIDNWWIDPHNPDSGCLIGLVSIIKNNRSYRTHMPDNYYDMSFSNKYVGIENYIADKSTHPEVAQWVREYAGSL